MEKKIHTVVAQLSWPICLKVQNSYWGSFHMNLSAWIQVWLDRTRLFSASNVEVVLSEIVPGSHSSRFSFPLRSSTESLFLKLSNPIIYPVPFLVFWCLMWTAASRCHSSFIFALHCASRLVCRKLRTNEERKSIVLEVFWNLPPPPYIFLGVAMRWWHTRLMTTRTSSMISSREMTRRPSWNSVFGSSPHHNNPILVL
jgi:hypothetical protein